MIDLVQLLYSKMKIRAIFTIIFVACLWLSKTSIGCICPSDFLVHLKGEQAASFNTATDICQGCGHTHNCCSRHQNLSMANIPSIEISPKYAIEASSYVLNYQVDYKKYAYLRPRFRAPPKHLIVCTPQALKQILLI